MSYYQGSTLCKFYNGLPGSCRNAEACPFSHSLKVVYDSRYRYVAPSLQQASPQVTKYSEMPNTSSEVKKPSIVSKNDLTERSANEETDGTISKMPEVSKFLDDYYSSSLKAEDLNAFKAEKFSLGSIPFLPPTKELA